MGNRLKENEHHNSIFNDMSKVYSMKLTINDLKQFTVWP